MNAIHIRLPNCRQCGREVELPPDCLALHLDNPDGGHTYSWICPWCAAYNTREAHDFVIGKLRAAGVHVIEAADQMASDLEDDDAIWMELDES